jgi:hypothetical protein
MSSRLLVAVVFSVLGAVGCTNTHSTLATNPLDVVTADVAKDGNAKLTLRDKLAARRNEQIARLEQYAAAGRFPQNLTQPTPSHQLKDANGTYCAVANLAVLDGWVDEIDAESKTNNALLFGDVKDGKLYAWILGSGLTQEEIAEIQAPAPFEGGGQLSGPVPMPRPVDPDKHSLAVLELQTHFRAVAEELRANTDASLDLAAARIQGADGSVAVAMR